MMDLDQWIINVSWGVTLLVSLWNCALRHRIRKMEKLRQFREARWGIKDG